MPATDAYTGALKKVVNPSMAAYPASRLTKLLASDQPVPTYQAHLSSLGQPAASQPETDGGIAVTTIGLVAGGALAVAVFLVFAVRRRRRMVALP